MDLVVGIAGTLRENVIVSLGSQVLLFGILAFIAMASSLLIWNGLADLFAGGAPRSGWRSWLRLAVGVVGFTFSLWVILGILTHAW